MYTPTKLTKKMIVDAFKEQFPNTYKEEDEFQFVIKLIDTLPNIVVSSDFPKDLLTDKFDLMLEVFADYEYDKMTDNDVNSLAEFIVDNTDIYKNCIDALFYALSTYAPNEILEKLIKSTSYLIDKYATEYKEYLSNELKKTTNNLNSNL